MNGKKKKNDVKMLDEWGWVVDMKSECEGLGARTSSSQAVSCFPTSEEQKPE